MVSELGPNQFLQTVFWCLSFTHQCVFRTDCLVHLGGRKRASADSSSGVLRRPERRLRYVIYILPAELCEYSRHHTTYVAFKEKSRTKLWLRFHYSLSLKT